MHSVDCLVKKPNAAAIFMASFASRALRVACCTLHVYLWKCRKMTLTVIRERKEGGWGVADSFPLMHIQIASVKSECKLTKCFPDVKNCCDNENCRKLGKIGGKLVEMRKRLKHKYLLLINLIMSSCFYRFLFFLIRIAGNKYSYRNRN